MDYVYPKYKLTNLYEPNWGVDYQPEWLTYTEEDAEEDKRENEIAAARERERKRQEEREKQAIFNHKITNYGNTIGAPIAQEEMEVERKQRVEEAQKIQELYGKKVYDTGVRGLMAGIKDKIT